MFWEKIPMQSSCELDFFFLMEYLLFLKQQLAAQYGYSYLDMGQMFSWT